MIKTYTLSFAMIMILAFQSNAQNFVSTTPTKKKAVLEEFTGVRCTACPSGHATIDGIKSTYGDEFIVVGLHPTNSSYTPPHPGDENLSRSFCDAFYTNPYYGNGDGRVMPSGHMNRRKYSGSRKLGASSWSSKVAEIIQEDSPVNVAVLSDLDTATNSLDINIEIYYTDNMPNENLISVYLAESNIFTTQTGANPTTNYQQKHVFREAIHLNQSQWGESLGNSFSAGDFIQKSYTFNLTPFNYDVDHSEIIVVLTDAATDEIITGAQTIADLTIPDAIAEQNKNVNDLKVFPNPASDNINLSWNASNADLRIMNIQGQIVMNRSFPNTNQTNLNVKTLSSGTYLIQLISDQGVSNQRVILK
jgi:hypothetical protein